MLECWEGNVMIGSKDSGKSHTSVNKNNDEDNCTDFLKK